MFQGVAFLSRILRLLLQGIRGNSLVVNWDEGFVSAGAPKPGALSWQANAMQCSAPTNEGFLPALLDHSFFRYTLYTKIVGIVSFIRLYEKMRLKIFCYRTN